ncbi:MAG: immunoglobulin domain-containing protein, partial [Verrucomicrobiota bacterium]
MKQTAKTTSVSLAIILQLLPVAKQVLTEITDFTPTISIIFRWGIGLSALLGGVDAVSGASTVITSPSTATGTNGVPFSFRLTTGPQVASSYTASPLPPGLILTASSGRITGTPTQSGVTVATVRGCDGGNGCTPNATLTITIVAGGGGGATPPTITSQPGNVTVTAGSSATFSVTAAGTAPLTYQWRYNAANIAGATGSSFSMASAQPANAGTYSVVVSNSAGTVTSANATLTVNPL